jgi:hypothetical protein
MASSAILLPAVVSQLAQLEVNNKNAPMLLLRVQRDNKEVEVFHVDTISA